MACAEVLVASEYGGRQASGVFWGLGVGVLFKLMTDGRLGRYRPSLSPLRASSNLRLTLLGVDWSWLHTRTTHCNHYGRWTHCRHLSSFL